MSIMRSNLWPVAAYLTMFFWLMMVNINNLPLGYHGTAQYFRTLSQLDGIAHLSVALSLTSIGTQVWGRRRTLALALTMVFVWEAFEIFTQPLLAGPSHILDSVYFADMFEDIVVGVAGSLVGVYYGGDEALNRSKAWKVLVRRGN